MTILIGITVNGIAEYGVITKPWASDKRKDEIQSFFGGKGIGVFKTIKKGAK